MPKSDSYFPKGQSGNPSGRPRDPLKYEKKLNRVAFEIICDELMYMNKDQLLEVMNAPDSPAVKMMIASVLRSAIVKGDHKRAAFLVEQMIGKPLLKVDATIRPDNPMDALLSRTPEERRQRIRDITAAIEKFNNRTGNAQLLTNRGNAPGTGDDSGSGT